MIKQTHEIVNIDIEKCLFNGGDFLVSILEADLKKGIEQGVQKARKRLLPILVSEVQKIKGIEPLHFFNAGQDIYTGERLFWKEPSGQTIFAGLGICKTIQSSKNSAERYKEVHDEWNQILKEAIIIKDKDMIGTGPMMFGGFSFDPLKEQTALWSNYAEALFHVPKFLLSIIDGEAFLTTNIICTENDNPAMVDTVLEERNRLLKMAEKKPGITHSLVKIGEREVVDPDVWKESVRNLVSDLINADLKKVVLARELRLTFQGKVKIEGVLQHLLQEQRDSFTFAFESNGDCFLGASPERLVKKEGKNMFSTCLAGSIARGKTKEEDEKLGSTLLNDDKNLIEHQYVVDMIKEAMEKVCLELDLPSKPTLMKMRDIQHLYTPVVGIAKSDSSLLQVVDSLHPTPALGGLPQRAAVEKIREIEELDRGYYAAPIGWLDYAGNGEFAVAIRSALIQGAEASLFAGCGIVQDSDAESEYVETKIKFRPMLSALGGLRNE